MVEIIRVLDSFVSSYILQFNKKWWEGKPRGPGISHVYLLLVRNSCSQDHMGCPAVLLHLYFLLSMPLFCILLSLLWVFSFSTSTAEPPSFATYLKHHLLCEAILDHFSPKRFVWTFRTIYSHFFITQISGVSYIWARQWKFAFICYFSSSHKAWSPLWKWN